MSKSLIESLCVLAEVTGTEWSKPTIRMIEQELSVYPEPDVLFALRRCQLELRHRVTLADILDRLLNERPGVEDAWGQVSQILNNEWASICWTGEMCEAYGAAASLADDPVAARMAFKERYTQLVAQARSLRTPIKWDVSGGWDKALRNECVREAERKNLISREMARKQLAYDIREEEPIQHHGFMPMSQVVDEAVKSIESAVKP